MAYRGHQKAITSLLAACGLGGAGYGTHKYIKHSGLPTSSVTTRSYNATSTVGAPVFTALPVSDMSAIAANLSETEVLIEVDGRSSIPPNTAFRKQSFGGPLSRSSIVVAFASLFHPLARNVGTSGWLICGLAILVTLYTVFLSHNARFFFERFTPPPTIPINLGAETDKKNVQIASLKSSLGAAQSSIAAIQQVVDPESISPGVEVLELVKDLKKSRKPSQQQHQDHDPENERDIAGEREQAEQFAKRIQMLEDSNHRLKGDLKQSEDEIARLVEQSETDKAEYKRKKDHYKSVAHFAMSAKDALKLAEQNTEDSLQKKLHEIMAAHNEKFLVSQQDNETLQTQLAHAKKHQEGMTQKLAEFDQETIQQNMAIEAEVKRLRENENAQLLRTQKLEDASAEREKRLRDQLEKVQDDRAIEVNGLEMKIMGLKEEIKTLSNAKIMAIGDLQKHRQDLKRNLSEATQEKDNAITAAKAENEALKSSMSTWVQKEAALAKASKEHEGRIHELENELIRKLEDKERQIQIERTKFDNLVVWVKSKMKKPPQDTSKSLADQNDQPMLQPPASEVTSQGARPQQELAEEDGHLHDMKVAPLGQAGSSISMAQDSAVHPANSTKNLTQNQPTSTKPSTSIPGLFPTAPRTDSAQSLPAPGLSDPAQPASILLDFDAVNYTPSLPTAPQPSMPTEQSPHDTTYQSTSTSSTEPPYYLSQGRRSTEAEIGARHRLQPRRRNQTISNLRQTTPRSQSMSSTLQFDPQALAAAMTLPSVTPAQPDALALYDKASALGKAFTAQAESSKGAQPLNGPPTRPSIFEGKTFDLNVPPPPAVDAGAVEAGNASAQSTVKDGMVDDDEAGVEREDAL